MAKKKHNPIVPWGQDFYIVKRDLVTLYLWFIRSRAYKKDVAGGFPSREAAVAYLSKNWVAMTEKEIENILLVNE